MPGFLGTSKGDCWVVKLQGDGTIDWQKAYGVRTFVPPEHWHDSLDRCQHVAQLPDGHYLLSGTTTPALGRGHGRWALELDAAGEPLWQKAHPAAADVSAVSRTGRS